ncbi:hypothetical protein L7F22_023720 [Adiantum nelumboides]|nr:hypothetical protein [Adiantum nelumboides]
MTARTLDWAMAELMASTQAMKRLQEELDEVVAGEGAIHRLIGKAELGKLVYLKAVLKDTMRLHPLVPLLVPYMSMETCYLDGYKIPKGCRLLVNAWAIGRDDGILLVGLTGRSTSSPSDFSHRRALSSTFAASTLSSCHLAAADKYARASPWPFPSLSPQLPTLCTPLSWFSSVLPHGCESVAEVLAWWACQTIKLRRKKMQEKRLGKLADCRKGPLEGLHER